MTEEQEPFHPKKPTLVLFVIIVAILAAVLMIDWLFTFLKERF